MYKVKDTEIESNYPVNAWKIYMCLHTLCPEETKIIDGSCQVCFYFCDIESELSSKK